MFLFIYQLLVIRSHPGRAEFKFKFFIRLAKPVIILPKLPVPRIRNTAVSGCVVHENGLLPSCEKRISKGISAGEA